MRLKAEVRRRTYHDSIVLMLASRRMLDLLFATLELRRNLTSGFAHLT